MRMLNTNSFNTEVENSNGVVVVDFFATWCGPCKMLGPIFESLSKEFGNKATFVKVDIDQSLDIANKYRISSVPTMIVFKDGKPVDMLVGFMPKEKIASKIKPHL
ncbi:MAG: thioredoxin [Romboutsia sp.]|uniref:thioredoxin n=1 Tax=Romboutsia sp. TaxID=1965302 RepID=UPI003F3EB9B5